MRVGVIQPNYLPWRGYFDFIDDVDLFVFYDDVQYTKNDWRNRNRIKTPTGVDWMTVPVYKKNLEQSICETGVDYTKRWQREHINKLQTNYGRSPHFDEVFPALAALIETGFASIADLDIRLTRWAMEWLGIETETHRSSELAIPGTGKDRLYTLLREVGATVYLSGPAAKSYLNEGFFHENGIGLEYKTYSYGPYGQLWGGFADNLSIVDLLMNEGPDSRDYLKSRESNTRAI